MMKMSVTNIRQRSPIMHVFAIILILCTALYDAKLLEVTSSTELEDIIQSSEYAFVIFCDSFDSDECSGELEEFEGYFAEGIVDFPDVVGVVTTAEDSIQKYGVLEYPTLLFFRKGNPIILQDEDLENYDFPVWLQKNRDLQTNVLSDENFEHDTQAATGATTGDWFIMFYDPSCVGSLASWEHVAISLRQAKVVGRVDLSTNPKLKKRFKEFDDCPSFVMFSLGKMYEYKDDLINTKSLVAFAKGGFKKQDGVAVPKEAQENALKNLSASVIASFTGASLLARLIVIGGIVLLLLLIIIVIIVVATKKKQQRSKFD